MNSLLRFYGLLHRHRSKWAKRKNRPHVARPGLPEEVHISRLLSEFGNQVMRQVSEKSDEIDGTRLEKTMESCRVFGL